MVSMDGRGRALDNVMVERLWRSVKFSMTFMSFFRCDTVSDVRGPARESKFHKTDSRAYLGSKTVQPIGGSSLHVPVSANFYLLVCHTCPVSPASSRFNPTIAEHAKTQK